MGCVNATSNNAQKQKKASNHVEVSAKKQVRFQRLDGRKKSQQTSDQILQNVKITAHKLNELSEIQAKEAIDKHYLFADLSEQQKQKLISQLIEVSAKKGQYIFKQGDKGTCFFIITEGQVGVEINGKTVKTMARDEMFGELALMYAATRSASIKVLSDSVSLIAMKSYLFKKTMQQINLKNAAKMLQIVNRVKIFSYLNNKQKNIIANNLVRQPFGKDECIFKVDQPANSFYIIERGSVKIEIPGKQPIIIKQQDSFGQNSFYQNGQRSGSAFANEQNTLLISIGRQDIQKCLGQSVTGLIHHNVKKWAITRSELFAKYSPKEVDLIAETFQIKYSKGQNQVLMPKGKHPTGIIINMEGQINGQPPGTMFLDIFYGKKQNVLSQDLVKNNKGSYAILQFKALSKINQSIKMDKQWGQKKENSNLNISTTSNHEIKHQRVINNQKAKSEFESLELLQKLGQGQFGEVFLVRSPNHGNALYAIKCINIQQIKKEGIEQCILSERKILSKVTFPAIVGFTQAYKDSQFIYFMMQFINGVEMFDILREIGLVNKIVASYYIGTLILSIEFLHNLGVIYRDLKPENSVVGHDGKVFLIDLGTAKLLTQKSSYRTFTIIGTPHYMAPEVFQGKGYTFQVDYWSLGVMLYEFMCGSLPYGNNATNPYEIFEEIMAQPLKFPSFMNDRDAQMVIRRLLSKSYVQRSVNNGFNGIKKMSFFANFQWQMLLSGKMKAPYIPKKYRNVNANNFYKNLKGDSFLHDFYKTQNKKNQQLKKPKLCADNAEIEVWDQDEL